MIPLFYLGPLGSFVPLAPPTEAVERTSEMLGTTHESLNGTGTLDIRGYRRTWKISTAYLEEGDLSFLQSAFMGAISDPLRIIDPVSKNRLSASTSLPSQAASLPGANNNFSVTNGVLTQVKGTGPSLSYSQDIRSITRTNQVYLSYQTTAAGTLTMQPSVGGSTLGTACPLLPGETVTLSAYVRRTSGTGNVSIGLRPVTSATTLGTAVTSSTTTSATWTRISVTYAVPASGVIGAQVQFIASAAGTQEIACVQLERGSAPTNWVMGYGCPQVLFTELSETSPVYPLVDAAMTLRER